MFAPFDWLDFPLPVGHLQTVSCLAGCICCRDMEDRGSRFLEAHCLQPHVAVDDWEVEYLPPGGLCSRMQRYTYLSSSGFVAHFPAEHARSICSYMECMMFSNGYTSLLHITMYIDSTMLGCIHVSVFASKCPARDATPQCPFDQFDDVGVLSISEVDLGILQCTFHVVRRDLLLRKVVRQVGKHPADVERTRLVCVPDVYHLHHPVAYSRRRVRATWFLLRHVVQPLSILVLPLWIGYVGCLTARES